PPRYLARFKGATARLGHPMPPARTLRQHLDHLRRHEIAPEFASDLLAYHYGVTYANAPANPQRERDLTRAIKGWPG
ncbi:MAG: hypothetical protein HKO57_06180, partial [Akkermansiaceae bacterium]|nr:hypothetical protein [Akkermansiaceae bacterium]